MAQCQSHTFLGQLASECEPPGLCLCIPAGFVPSIHCLFVPSVHCLSDSRVATGSCVGSTIQTSPRLKSLEALLSEYTYNSPHLHTPQKTAPSPREMHCSASSPAAPSQPRGTEQVPAQARTRHQLSKASGTASACKAGTWECATGKLSRLFLCWDKQLVRSCPQIAQWMF